jgi:hypothetical protein
MKTQYVSFDFIAEDDSEIGVTFAYNAHGHPVLATVYIDGDQVSFDNSRGTYKPSVSHCKDLIKRAKGTNDI